MSTNKPIKPLGVLDDIALMRSIQGGQTEKLGLLFERYHRQLYGFFVKLTHDSNASEDLVQNVFFRILKYKHSFNLEKKFTTWMYQIARNVFHDQYRKNSKTTSVDSFEGREPRQEAKVDFDEKDERIDLLKRALLELPEDKREILVMSKYQGLRYKEIGDIFDCSETAVKVKAHRAMKELKKIYIRLEKNLAV